MKSVMVFLLAFIALFALAFGADCDVKGHEFNKGESYTPTGECTKITCDGPNQISALGCPDVQSLKPCKYIPADNSKSYPECCPKFEC